MKTKIALLSTALVLAAASLKAQNSTGDMGSTTFGIRAGVNFQNVNGKDETGKDLDNKLITGFNVGVNAEIPVATDFYFQPGLLFTTKGAKDDRYDATLNLSYLELPLNFLYKPTLGTGKLILGLGPYVAFGVGGKLKVGGQSENVEFKSKVDYNSTSDKPTFKRFDAGANFLFGYELSSRISAQFNAQLGLINIYPKIENIPSGFSDESKAKNTGFGISLGYRFGG